VSDGLAIRIKLTSFALLAVVGTWLAHAIEYARVAGVRGLVDGLAGPLHTYMVPAGAVIAVLTFCVATGFVRAAGRMKQRRRELKSRLASAFRGRPGTLGAASPPAPSRKVTYRAILAGFASLQLILYLLQENIEAAAAGSAAPGLGAVTGAHWAAPLVHFAVAALLALVVIAIRRVFTTRLRAIATLVAVLGVLLRQLRATTVLPHPRTASAAVPAWLTASRFVRGPPEPVGR